MIAAIPSATVLGADGRPVTVEVHVGKGLPGFTVVGLPDTSCREARDRVRAALLSSGRSWPQQRVTVNLAPSGVRKVGAGLDLAIAVAVLVAAGDLKPEAVAGMGFVGELGLDGSVRPVAGIVPLTAALQAPIAVVPADAVGEAAVLGRHEVRPVRTIVELLDALEGVAPWPRHDALPPLQVAAPDPDLADVHGHPVARLALELAASGGHHLLLVGPPGSGKTMLAERLPGLLPDLDPDDALDATRVRSASGLPLPPGGLVLRPPLRRPHQGTSAVALVGGGTAFMRPGEVSMSHGGVLFLDELAEFPPSVLDQLRQPLEEGVVHLSRAREAVTLPARFLLVAAMNPCPCGHGGPPGACRCAEHVRLRYGARVSGPLLDRFDLRIPVERPDAGELVGGERGEATGVVRARVEAARSIARERGVRCNAELRGTALAAATPLTSGARALLEHALRTGALTGRGLHRVRRVARTLADLRGAPDVLDEQHVATALSLRAERILDGAA